MQKQKGAIKYFVIIIVILAIVFFSQQPSALKFIKDFSTTISKYAGASLTGAINLNTKNTATTDTKAGTSASTTDSAKLTDSAFNSTSASTTAKIEFSATNKETITNPTISEKVTEALKSGGEVVANTLNSTKENISSAEKNISNYFSEVTTSIIKPGTPQNCPTVETPAK